MTAAKPAPLMIGGNPVYSLSSYDPVEVEVVVPYTSDGEVELALSRMVGDEGGTEESLKDAAWISKHFEGLRSVDELRRVVRARLREMNEQFAEGQKRDKCLLALSERLEQSVPNDYVAMVRGNIRTSFEQRAAANNMTMDQFIERGGVSAAEFDAMLDEQARQSAEIDAALEAYVREKKVKANERDYPRLLGIDPEIAKVMFKQARAAGTFDQIERAALRGKAADEVVSECRCTYHHESEAEAAERLKMLREIMAQG